MTGAINMHGGSDSVRKLRFLGFLETRRPHAERGTVLSGEPDWSGVVRDVLYFPEYDCLYDGEGRRIVESCLRRGGKLAIESRGPERVDVPTECRLVTDPLVYVGSLGHRHWGHLLTEGIARLHVLKNIPERSPFRALYHGPAPSLMWGHVRAFLNHCGIEPDALVRFDEPVRLSEVLLPMPSMVNGSHIFNAHAFCPGLVSNRIAGRDSGPASDQPVYLSRRKLAGAQRRISREAELESILATKGHRIVYPEEISFEDQVRLFNSHKTFTGCIGSAFHSVLFAREDTNVSTVVFARETVGVNYLMIDKIKSTSATYIKCLEDDESSAKESTFRDQVLDIDVALFHLRLMGIL